MNLETKNPIISVVVPVYNCIQYLPECVQSIRNQTYKNIEIILVDDGSNDGSELFCDNLKNMDSRVKVLHKQNEGVSAARNDGIAACSGDYVTFIDSDDFVDDRYCEYLLTLCKSNNADIALTPQPLKYRNSSVIENIDGSEDSIEVWSGVEAAANMLYYKVVISSWNKMYSLDLLNRNQIRFVKTLSYGEGFQFVINSFLHSEKVACGSRKLYRYRVDNINSVMTNFKEKLVYGSFDSLENIKVLISEHQELQPAWVYAYWHTSCDCLNTIVGSCVKKEQMELYKMLKKRCRKCSINALKAPVNSKEKVKAILYGISPDFAANIINTLRKRKFTKV